MREKTLAELREARRPRSPRVRMPGEANGNVYEDPPGTTASPRLPKPAPDLKYLDITPGTTPSQFLNRVQSSEKEVLAFSKGGKIDFAPVVGERSFVDLEPIGQHLADVDWLHCHPVLAPFSLPDLTSVVVLNGRSSQVRLPDGRTMTVLRPNSGWPKVVDLQRAYSTGFTRGMKAAARKSDSKRFAILFKETQSQLATVGVVIDVK